VNAASRASPLKLAGGPRPEGREIEEFLERGPRNWFQGPGESQLASGDGSGVMRPIASIPGDQLEDAERGPPGERVSLGDGAIPATDAGYW
jgi:hypothetical protein